MFKTDGSLRVKRIHGRRGEFAVGTLNTSIGTFVVKDPELDQYDAGEYEGDFGIAEVGPRSYFTDGRLIVEMRATLAFMVINTMDDEAEDEQPVELDPIEEQPVITPQKAAVTSITSNPGKSTQPTAASKESKPQEADADAGDEALFGPEIYPLVDALADVIKLDPTVGRQRLRPQANRLKALGYRFNPTQQQWERRQAA